MYCCATWVVGVQPHQVILADVAEPAPPPGDEPPAQAASESASRPSTGSAVITRHLVRLSFGDVRMMPPGPVDRCEEGAAVAESVERAIDCFLSPALIVSSLDREICGCASATPAQRTAWQGLPVGHRGMKSEPSLSSSSPLDGICVLRYTDETERKLEVAFEASSGSRPESALSCQGSSR